MVQLLTGNIAITDESVDLIGSQSQTIVVNEEQDINGDEQLQV